MSAVYNLEPPPTAKVLLTTTAGDLLLELFAKQTPLASRSFLQHCLDGYYTNTVFHRLVPNFIIQGGDPTNTGHGGEAAYTDHTFPNDGAFAGGTYRGGTFDDEFHSRLKWNRRGLLGMANGGGGGKNDNGSQFFLTLGETSELEGRNTLFGRVVGDTIFNLVKMGEAELEGGSERPLFPTKVTGCEVLVNPFGDMVRREVRVKGIGGGGGKKRGGKVLLSFGEEGEEGEEAPVVVKKAKFNSKLVVADTVSEDRKEVNGGAKAEANGGAKAVKNTDKAIRRRISRPDSPPRILKPNPEQQLPLPNDEVPSRSPTESPEPEQLGKVSTLLEQTNAEIANLKASMKRNIQSAPALEKKKKSALEQMIPETAMRGRKRKLGVNGDAPADKQTMNILNAFRAKLESAPAEVEASASLGEANKQVSMNGNKDDHNDNDDEEAVVCDLHFVPNCQSCRSWDQENAGDAGGDDDDKGWMSHALSFEKDRLGKDLTWKRKNEEELVVIDPKEKAKDLREEQKAKKMARMGSNTAWDRDRDRGRAPERMAGQKG